MEGNADHIEQMFVSQVLATFLIWRGSSWPGGDRLRHPRAAEPGIELTGGGARGAAGKTVSIVAPDAGTLVLSRAVFWSKVTSPRMETAHHRGWQGRKCRLRRPANGGRDRSLLDLARRLVARLANLSLQLWHGRDCVR